MTMVRKDAKRRAEWQRAVRRSDVDVRLLKDPKVCERHFKSEHLRTTSTYTDCDGRTIEAPMKLTRLTPDALPSQPFFQTALRISRIRAPCETCLIVAHIEPALQAPEMLVSVVVTEDLSVSVYFKCAPLVSDDVCIPDEVRDVRVLDNLLDSVLRDARQALIRPCGSPAHTLQAIAQAATGSRDFQAFTRHFEFVAQSATSAQPRSRGGFAFPYVAVTASILSLGTLFRVLNNDGTPAQTLARYHLGPSLRVLVPAGPINCGPQSSHLTTVYRALVAFHRRLEPTRPDIDVAEAKVVDTMAALVQPLVLRHRHAVMSRPRKHMAVAALPGNLRDFGDGAGACSPLEIGCNGGRWYAPTLAPTASWLRPPDIFWRAVHARFRGQGVRGFVSGGWFPRGCFAALLLAAGLFSFWRNRCEAVAGNCRRRALWPILGRMRREILALLSEEIFFLGERELLRHWSCRFVALSMNGSNLFFRPT
ncbi:hypothetical protein HPB52_014767 [Rhipicephalus sanguineus]|uniref:THAP-type domain-containing protein n=1 Tax=Rhipicephalus sanguineus TaxID=34632 RepID=A0A9D4T3V2_RHISA|nr:hypothetical protein HPB52_014767 [Rhipicephalus sanguineus]